MLLLCIPEIDTHFTSPGNEYKEVDGSWTRYQMSRKEIQLHNSSLLEARFVIYVCLFHFSFVTYVWCATSFMPIKMNFYLLPSWLIYERKICRIQLVSDHLQLVESYCRYFYDFHILSFIFCNRFISASLLLLGRY